METFIFTETVNCSEITKVMLRSFYRHHPNKKIHIFGGEQDFLELHDEGKHENAVLIDIKQYDGLEEKYKIAHQGTAYVFALVISGSISQKYDSFIHLDSDILFKKESLSLIENAFEEGFDIVGSRRCYGNNPSNVPNLSQLPDSISTYFLGMKLDKIPNYGFEKLCKYCEGAEHPLGWLVLDFFDGVTHSAINNGAKIKFLDQEAIGGQDEFGKKNSKFTSNLHFDCGSHLIHFGGVGSGYAYSKGKKGASSPYYNWAMGRYSLFKRFFEKESIGFNESTVYGSDGRWVNGNYDDNILQNLEIDAYFDGNKELYRWEKEQADHLRYEFDLDENSLVVDVGGYDGQWAKVIYDRHKCRIDIYEPVPEFYHKIKILFFQEYKVWVLGSGLSDSDRLEKIYLNENSSSTHKKYSGQSMDIIMEDVSTYEKQIVDLLKINIEGDEYNVLNRIIELGFQKNIKNILVQFHTFVDGYEEKKAEIETQLLKTHDKIFDYEYVWTHYKLKS